MVLALSTIPSTGRPRARHPNRSNPRRGPPITKATQFPGEGSPNRTRTGGRPAPSSRPVIKEDPMRSRLIPRVPRTFLAGLGALVASAPLAWAQPPCAPPVPSPCAPARPLITYPQVIPTPTTQETPTTLPEQRPSPAAESEPAVSPPPIASGRS